MKYVYLHVDLAEDIYMTSPRGLFSSSEAMWNTNVPYMDEGKLSSIVWEISTTGFNQACIQLLKQQLQASFDMKDLGYVLYILGLKVHSGSKSVLSQSTQVYQRVSFFG